MLGSVRSNQQDQVWRKTVEILLFFQVPIFFMGICATIYMILQTTTYAGTNMYDLYPMFRRHTLPWPEAYINISYSSF